MNVHQLIYTKFEAWDHSPLRKSGFHTAYYSKEILDAEKIMELEKWMVFPTKRAWKEKDVPFFTEIKGKIYFVILHSHYLPEARDHTGRTGIYLCQGFLFEEKDWHKMKDPMQLLDLVTERGLIFSDREAVLESHLIDRETGDIGAIQIPDAEVIDNTHLLPEFTDFEYGIISLVLKCLTHEFIQPIFLKGPPKLINSILRKILTFLPIRLKSLVGWDPDFRREVFNPFPGRIIGIGSGPPKTMGAITVDLQKRDIFQTLSQADANSTFIRWTTTARKEIQTFNQIELGYELSQIIDYEENFAEQDYSEVENGFVAANNNQISRVFIKKAQGKFALDMGSSDHLSQYFNPIEKLQLIINDLPNEEFYEPLERLIFEHKKTVTLPPGLKNEAPPKLALLGRMQQGEKLSQEDLNGLKPTEIHSFINYILVCQDLSQNWIIKLVGTYPVPLEEFLKQGIFANHQLKNLVSWAQTEKSPEGNYPYINAYLFPRSGLDEAILRNKKTMVSVYKCMQEEHKFNPADFETMGLEDTNRYQSSESKTKGPEKSRFRKFLGM